MNCYYQLLRWRRNSCKLTGGTQREILSQKNRLKLLAFRRVDGCIYRRNTQNQLRKYFFKKLCRFEQLSSKWPKDFCYCIFELGKIRRKNVEKNDACLVEKISGIFWNFAHSSVHYREKSSWKIYRFSINRLTFDGTSHGESCFIVILQLRGLSAISLMLWISNSLLVAILLMHSWMFWVSFKTSLITRQDHLPSFRSIFFGY